jgi:hypothetical protein
VTSISSELSAKRLGLLNMRTAKTLGLTMAPSLLRQADRIIE